MSGPSDKQMRLSGTNLERAGDHNQRVTLHAIRVNGPITRAELAVITPVAWTASPGWTAPSNETAWELHFGDPTLARLIEDVATTVSARGS